MKATKTLELGKLKVKAVIEDFKATELVVAGVKLDLVQAQDLVEWVRLEVLGLSTPVPVISHVPLTPIPMPQGPTTVQTFPANVPALEDRSTGRVSNIPKIESALAPGEPDPYADRKVGVKYKQVTDPREVGSTAGVEMRSGVIEKPFTVKL